MLGDRRGWLLNRPSLSAASNHFHSGALMHRKPNVGHGPVAKRAMTMMIAICIAP
jgi:hypothetical protein